MTWAPAAVEAPETPMVRPLAMPTRTNLVPVVLPTRSAAHCWLVPPLHVHCSSWVPSTVDLSGTSRHRPLLTLTRVNTLSATRVRVHRWLAPPLDCHWMILAPFAVEPPLTSITSELSASVRVWAALVGTPESGVQVP